MSSRKRTQAINSLIENVDGLVVAIESKQQDVVELVERLKSDFDDMKPVIDDLQPNIDALQPLLDELQPKVDGLTQFVEDAGSMADAVTSVKNDSISASSSADRSATMAILASTATVIDPMNKAISVRAVVDHAQLIGASVGLPENTTPITASFFSVDPTYGPYLRRPIDTISPYSVYHKQLFNADKDTVVRIRVRARFKSAFNAGLRVALVRDDGTTATVVSIPITTQIVPNTLQTFEATIGRRAGGLVTNVIGTEAQWNQTKFIRTGIASLVLAAGEWYDTFSIDAEDVTILDQKIRQDTALITTAPNIVQKFMMEPIFGSNAAGDPAEIYTGSRYAAQGVCTAVVSGVEYAFVTQRFTGANHSAEERSRIAQFVLKSDGTTGAVVAFSGELNLGHAANISAMVDPATQAVTLISYMPVDPAHTGDDSGKGISVITWKGAATAQADVQTIRLFGWNGTSERRSQFYHVHSSVSTDGKYLACACPRRPEGTTFNPAVAMTGMIFDLQEVLAAADPLAVTPLKTFPLKLAAGSELHVLQGVAMNKTCFAVLFGYGNWKSQNAIQLYTYDGQLIRDIRPTLEGGRYGLSNLMNHATLGIPIQMEPEGLCFRNETEIIALVLDQWATGGSIVSYQGKNFACTTNATTNRIHTINDWVATSKAPNAGEWVPTGSYTSQSSVTRRVKKIWSIRVATGESGELPLAYGIGDAWFDIAQGPRAPNSAPDIEYQMGDTFQISGWSAQEDRHYKGIEFFDNYAANVNTGIFGVWSPFGATNRYGRIRVTTGDGQEHIEFGGSDAGTWGRVMCYGVNDPTTPNIIRILNGDGTGIRINSAVNGAVRPDGGLPSLGTTTNRFNYVYLTNNPDVSSDERLKTPLEALTDKEKTAALEIAASISTFKLIREVDDEDFVERTKIGVGAQTVVAIMEKHGLDPESYDFVKLNREVDDDGVMQESYSVAYEQLLALVTAALAEKLLSV